MINIHQVSFPSLTRYAIWHPHSILNAYVNLCACSKLNWNRITSGEPARPGFVSFLAPRVSKWLLDWCGRDVIGTVLGWNGNNMFPFIYRASSSSTCYVDPGHILIPFIADLWPLQTDVKLFFSIPRPLSRPVCCIIWEFIILWVYRENGLESCL